MWNAAELKRIFLILAAVLMMAPFFALLVVAVIDLWWILPLVGAAILAREGLGLFVKAGRF